MDDIQHSEYLRVNKYLLFAVSAWPYQTIFQRSLVGIILIPIVTAQLILQFGGMITAIIADDIESLLESFAPLAISLMCFVKYINFLYNFNQLFYWD